MNLTNRWHSRLGHISLKNLNVLVKNGYLHGKEVHTLDFCKICVLSKAHKLSFSSAKHVTTEIIGYVHSDRWGSMSNEERLSGCKFFSNDD